MQPSSREMQCMAASLNRIPPQIALQDLQKGHAIDHSASGGGGGGGGGVSGHDDFFDQMLSGLPAGWPELVNPEASSGGPKLFNIGLGAKSPEESPVGEGFHYAPSYDESSLLASQLRQHQISGASSPTGKQMMLQLNHHSQQQMLLSAMGRSPTSAAGGDPGLLPLPLTLGSGSSADAPLKSPTASGGEGLYNGYGGSLLCGAQEPPNQQQFHHPQNYGGAHSAGGAGQATAASASTASGSAGAPPRQRVRARRGQATDPHSIAERLRRERIAERMKALQELVPNANKTDKASMLDEIIDYVKFLQLQVKVLSMSRLGGAAAVAPLVADLSLEGQSGSGRTGTNGAAGSDSLTVTEHQVAKLMEEDMGSAMQYLQGKGLCLMPISLASAISSATCHPRPSPSSVAAHLNHGLVPAAPPQPPPAGNTNNATGDAAPSSPSMSVLTVQSAMANGASDIDGSRQYKDSASASNPRADEVIANRRRMGTMNGREEKQ